MLCTESVKLGREGSLVFVVFLECHTQFIDDDSEEMQFICSSKDNISQEVMIIIILLLRAAFLLFSSMAIAYELRS